ncbi:hypothetical protein ACS0TY_002458 [Phlomoides rotata]
MNNLKLAVEVVRAHNLLPKNGQGSSNALVELHFDNQTFRTTVKENDLNPFWNEIFYFNILNPINLQNLALEAHVYNIKTTNSRSSLGKIRITGTSFVAYSDAVIFNYPLEKVSIFSRARGELGLKVYITDDQFNRPQTMTSSSYSSLHSIPDEPAQRVEEAVPDLSSSNGRTRTRRKLHNLPDSNQQQQPRFPVPPVQTAQFRVNEMRGEPQMPQAVRAYPGSVDFMLKETYHVLGGKVRRADKSSIFDLVEPMQFLFVRVVKARDLPNMDLTGSLNPYVEVKLGNYKGVTKHFEKNKNPEWNTVFTFSKERMQASVLEVVVKDKDRIKDDFVGVIRFDLYNVPRRVPPDSPLAPEWYRLKDKKGENKNGELMLAVWIGTQADEAFADAFHSDAASPVDSSVPSTHTRSKVYHSPRLWYVRVNVIEAQDLVVVDRNRFPNVHVKVQIGNQVWKTKPVQSQTMSAFWNEDLMFVTAEPFDDHLVLSVEDRVGPNKDESLGKVFVPLATVERRADDRAVHSCWFNLQKPGSSDVEEPKKDHFFARILNADALMPMKTRNGRGTSDTFCVAKYGQKWVRTRTITDSLNPKFNEQYTWDVFDPSTVLTVGVFDNGHIVDRGSSSNGNKDLKIGKVRIRISTLETGRVYTHSYPLINLQSSGVKKMGELHLAIRFSCTSMVNMMSLYSRPLLPKMHYIRPLSVMQLESLRHQAVSIVAARLNRAEPSLRKEVIEYMTDANSHLWSMRRSKANFWRLISVFSGLITVSRWIKGVCLWKNYVTTILVHILLIMLISFPELILPTLFLYMFLIGLWNYRFRPKYPPHMNMKLSCADTAHQDELDEEFDTFPSTRNPDIIRIRYERLRSVAGRIQTIVGDVASQGERIQGLLSWRDPRATVIFMGFCIVSVIVFYTVPLQLLIVLAGLYSMRHPKFRHKLPPRPLNFFRRLPARTDSML